MSYREFCGKIRNDFESVAKIISFLDTVKGKKVLIFSHDDPDGITSCVIMKKVLESRGAKVSVKFPDTYELEEYRLKEALAEEKYYAVFLLDKGTMGYYDAYSSIVPNFFVIDHHFPQGSFSSITVFNPALKKYEFCSCSYLVNVIAELTGCRDEHIDFLTLIGLKGDWAIEPATDFISDYVKPFVEEVKPVFSLMFEKITAKPTMFEVAQREKTTLLSLTAEFIHAVCGGGFQYFYNDRDAELKDVDHVELVFNLLSKISKKMEELKKAKDLKSFTAIIPQKPLAKKIYRYFESDWERSMKMMDSYLKLAQFNDTAMYFFCGTEVPLIPMVGSVKLYEITKSRKDKYGLFIMVNHEKTGGTHFSVRSTGVEVHVGKICGNIAKILQDVYNDKVNITGGGHPKAGECKTRKAPAPLERNVLEFFRMFDEMYRLNEKKELSEQEKKRAVELGLEYIK